MVTTWAAISSILFIQTVIVSQGSSQLFKFEQAAIVEGIDEDDPCIRWWLSGLSLLLQGHIIGAFLFLVHHFDDLKSSTNLRRLLILIP